MAGDPPNGSRTHEPPLRELVAELDGFKQLMDERDKRYTERDSANKEAVRSALAAAEKAGEKTEVALKEYKESANEWRATVTDLVAKMITRPDVERELKGLELELATLRDALNLVSGQQRGGRTVKDDTRANAAILIALLGFLAILARTLMGH